MFRIRHVIALIMVALMFVSILTPNAYANNLGINHDPEISKEHFELYQSLESQEALLNQPATLQEGLENKSGNVNVIVHFTEPSVGLARGLEMSRGRRAVSDEELIRRVTTNQGRAVRAMNAQNINFSQGRAFKNVLNAQAMTVDAKDLHKLLEIDEIAYVEEDVFVSLDPEVDNLHNQDIDHLEDVKAEDLEPSYIPAIPHLEIPKVWELGEQGEGVKVGVLDTGIDYNHPDLKEVYKGGRNYVSGSNYNTQRAADDPFETRPSERPEHLDEYNEHGSSYWTTHGTHVAGTIAATGQNDYGMIGVAPKVDIHAYRVLGAYGSGAISWIISGIEDSVLDGMDIINLSLGVSTPSESDSSAFAVNNAMLLGTVAISATGNSGPNRSTVNSPASGTIGISVGNSTLPERRVDANITIEAGDFSETLDASFMALTYDTLPENQLNSTERVVAVPNLGRQEDYKNIDVEGKVALVKRGEIPFVDKIKFARENGAVGIIIFNSENGTNSPNVIDIFLGAAFEFLPTLDISNTIGQPFYDAVNESEGTITFNSYNSEVTGGDTINPSSSRGPSTPNFDIKPDVVAPGTNILSTIPVFEEFDPDLDYTYAYDQKTGTSMATPHVAGIAALLLDINPNLTPFDVKSLLSNTARQLNTEEFDVFDQGAGLVQPYRAATANVILKVEHETIMDGVSHLHTRGTMSFGYVNPESESISKSVILEGRGGSGTYDIEVEPIRVPGGALSNINLTPNVSQVSVSDTEEVIFTLNIPEGTPEPNSEFLGYIHFKNSEEKYSIPFAVGLGKQVVAGFTEFELSSNHISPNDDGVNDSTTLAIDVGAPMEYALVSYFDLLNPSGGIYNDGIISNVEFLIGLNERTILPIDGTGFNIVDGTHQYEDVPDGVYTIDAFGTTAGSSYTDFGGPLFIKREPTKVSELVLTNSTIEGSVDDLYIEVLTGLQELYNFNYNPNNFVESSYTLSNGEAETHSFTFDNDGKFVIEGKENGVYHLTLNFSDIAGNEISYEYTVDFDNGTVNEGYQEIPSQPSVPERDIHILELSKIQDDINRNNIREIRYQAPETVTVDKPVHLELNQDVITALSEMRKNKSLVLEYGDVKVQLTNENFQDFLNYDAVEVIVSAEESSYVTPIYSVEFVGVNGETREPIVSTNSPFLVHLKAPSKSHDVIDINSSETFRGQPNYDNNSGFIIIEVTTPSSYSVISQ